MCIQGQLTSSCSLECSFWYTKLPGVVTTYVCIKKALVLIAKGESEAINRAVCGSNLSFVCNTQEWSLQSVAHMHDQQGGNKVKCREEEIN